MLFVCTSEDPVVKLLSSVGYKKLPIKQKSEEENPPAENRNKVRAACFFFFFLSVQPRK